jgi:hypothetical protein
MFREKLSQVLPVPEDHGFMPPPPRNASPPCVATVYNKLTGGGGCWWSPSEHTAYLAPALCMFGLLPVCVFWHLPLPPVKVSRTSRSGPRELVPEQGPESEVTCKRWHSKQGHESEVMPG